MLLRSPPCRLVASRHHSMAIEDGSGGVYSWGGGGPSHAEPRRPEPSIARDHLGRKKSVISEQNPNPPPSPQSLMVVADAQTLIDTHHLGHGNANETACIARPRRVAGLESITIAELSAGPSHLLLLTHGGEVFSCGHGAHGRLGHGSEDSIAIPKRIEGIHDEGCWGTRPETHGHAVRVSAGSDHSLVLTDLGLVYSFGSGMNGRHGHDGAPNQWYPKPLKAFHEISIRDVSAGPSHSSAITAQGELYLWGAGGSGQLGVGDVGVGPTYQRRVPTLIEDLEGIPVKQASCGTAHTLVVTETGELFSFGFGAHGRLGHGDHEDSYKPKRVEGDLLGNAVRLAAAGEDHSIVLTERGQVFTFGSDRHGKLGHRRQPAPALPPGVGSHLKATLPSHTAASVAADEVMRIYAFGKNRSTTFGKPDDVAIGHGQDESVSLPTRVESLLQDEVVEVAAGSEHTLVRIGHGKDGSWWGDLHAFGCNDDGQLGLPWLADQGDKYRPAKVDWPPPVLPDTHADAASALGGFEHSTASEAAAKITKALDLQEPPHLPSGWYPVSRN